MCIQFSTGTLKCKDIHLDSHQKYTELLNNLGTHLRWMENNRIQTDIA